MDYCATSRFVFSITTLLIMFVMLRSAFATPLHQHLTRSTSASRHLKNQLMSMRTTVDQAVSDFVSFSFIVNTVWLNPFASNAAEVQEICLLEQFLITSLAYFCC